MPKKVKRMVNNIENLMCSICLSILVEPVLLPCRHGFCLSCFNDNLVFNSLICPYCRKRFGSWLRQATKDNCLIDKELWSFIKKNCKQQLKDKKELEITSNKFSDDTSAVTEPGHIINISKPGEIRKEFEQELQKFQEELEKEKQNELKATFNFIIKEFGESHKSGQDNQTERKTMLVANPGHTPYALNKTSCSSKANLNIIQPSSSSSGPIASTSSAFASSSGGSTSSSTSTVARPVTPTKCSLIKTFSIKLNRGTEFIKHAVHKKILSKISNQFSTGSELYTVPPTSIHRTPSRNTNSTDSLTSEMCHFKPIRTVPITPTKRLGTNGSLTTPKVKRFVHIGNANKLIRSPKPCTIPENLTSPSSKSAFCSLANPENISSHTVKCEIPIITHSNINESDKLCRIKSKTKFEMVLDEDNKKLDQVDSVNIVEQKKDHDKEKGVSLGNSENGKRRSRRIRNCRENSILNEFKLTDDTVLTKVITEQKKCENLIKQEMQDFEYAKKLQAELDTEISRTNPRKTRHKISTVINGEDDKTDTGVIPPAKRPRKNSQKFQQSQSRSKVVVKQSSNNIINLRRSTRRTKKV